MTVFLYYLCPNSDLENEGQRERERSHQRASVGLMQMLEVETRMTELKLKRAKNGRL